MNIWLDESPPEGDFIWLMRSEDVIEVLKTNLCDKLSIGKLTDNAAYDTLLWIEEQAYKGNRACVPNDIKIHASSQPSSLFDSINRINKFITLQRL